MDVLLEKIAAEQDYVNYKTHISEVSTGGSSLASTLFLVELRAKGKPNLKLFVKVAAFSDKKRQFVAISCPYTTELFFYRNVQKQLQQMEDRHCIPDEHRVRMPKLYGINDEYLKEIVVLENLTAEGFENYDREKPADLEYMSTAIELMAKFHALSLAFHEYDPENFARLNKTLTYDISRFETFIPGLARLMLDNAFKEAESVHVDKLKKYFAKDQPHRFGQLLDLYRPRKRNILLHGDFKPSNLMHRRRNGKLEIVPVDFQMVRDGDPVMDLLYFIYAATDEQLRRDHYQALLDEYYEHLRAALHRLHLDPERVYSEKTYREELKQCTMLGLVIAVALLPSVFADEEESEGLKQSGVEDADFIKYVAIIVKSSALFKERFNGVLNNYVEWGLL